MTENPDGKRPLGRSRLRRKDPIERNVEFLNKSPDWKILAADKEVGRLDVWQDGPNGRKPKRRKKKIKFSLVIQITNNTTVSRHFFFENTSILWLQIKYAFDSDENKLKHQQVNYPNVHRFRANLVFDAFLDKSQIKYDNCF